MNMWAKTKGFTIVELLIVIVVIAVLAAITIVAYNGIQQRAQVSSLQSNLSQAARKLELYKVDNDVYPTDPSLAGVTSTSDLGVSYTRSSSGTGYCISYVKNTISYFLMNGLTQSQAGGCPPSSGLVASWLFNGNADDSSGNGINGTVSGATLTTGQNGQANSAYSFNGTSNYIALPSSSLLNFPSTNFSVSAWINTANIPSTPLAWYDILSSTSTGDWSFGINANTQIRAMMTKVSQTDSPSTAQINQNTWQFLTVNYTYGGASPATVAYYLDGALTSSVTWNHTTQGNFSGGTKRIGARSGTGYFKGSIDDIRVYNRLLTNAEISSMYAAGAQ